MVKAQKSDSSEIFDECKNGLDVFYCMNASDLIATTISMKKLIL